MGICSGISTEWLFIHCFQVKLEFRNVIKKCSVCGERITGESGEKPPSMDRNQHQTESSYGVNSRIQTVPQWWEASALPTVPSLLPDGTI